MPDIKMQSVTLEGVRIVFRNFSGKEGQYNREGDRNFSVILPEDIAEQMVTDGWNIKYLKPRDEEEAPQAYMQVAVKYSNNARPPRVVMITSKGKTPLGEDDISVMDWAEFNNVDLIVRPYQWAVNGKTGVKAYLQSIFATLEEDELEKKYIDVPDSAQNAIGGAEPMKAIGSSQEMEDMGEIGEYA